MGKKRVLFGKGVMIFLVLELVSNYRQEVFQGTTVRSELNNVGVKHSVIIICKVKDPFTITDIDVDHSTGSSNSVQV